MVNRVTKVITIMRMVNRVTKRITNYKVTYKISPTRALPLFLTEILLFGFWYLLHAFIKPLRGSKSIVPNIVSLETTSCVRRCARGLAQAFAVIAQTHFS